MASAIEKVEINDTNDYPDSEEPPKHHVRWFHGGPPMLLSSAPVTLGPTPVWQPFTREESDACEESWQALSEDEKITPLGSADDTTDEDHDDAKVGIPVSRDKLFEVDVISMKVNNKMCAKRTSLTITSHSSLLCSGRARSRYLSFVANGCMTRWVCTAESLRSH